MMDFGWSVLANDTVARDNTSLSKLSCFSVFYKHYYPLGRTYCIVLLLQDLLILSQKSASLGC